MIIDYLQWLRLLGTAVALYFVTIALVGFAATVGFTRSCSTCTCYGWATGRNCLGL